MIAAESAAMGRAVSLAWKGWGRVHPNPLVGAVVLSGGREVGSGWHAEFGGPHAEAVALHQAGDATLGSTLVVTLEPCRHHGKQPPCTDAILAAGVRRVVVGQPDPHALAGGGGAVLEAHGVEVATLDAPEARYQNAPFFHAVADPTRPFVALKLATSLDGRVADATGRARWVSGPEAREYVQWIRAGYEAIGVGGATARIDNPRLTVRGAATPRVPPRRVVFSRSGRIDGAHHLLGADGEPPATVFPSVVDGLRSLREEGVASILIEGGGILASELLAANLVDRFYWIQAPIFLGSAATPAFPGLPGGPLPDAARWAVVERKALGPDTLLVLDRP